MWVTRAKGWFWELRAQSQRDPTTGALHLLRFQELEAWTRYTGARPTYIERHAIQVLDHVFLQVMNEV